MLGHAIHHVFANRSDLGDWLSARGIQALLGAHEFREHRCDRPFVEGTLAALSRAGPDDLIVIGGGGLFQDYYTPFWEGFQPIAHRVPFCIWGVGYVDLKAAPSQPFHAFLQEHALLEELLQEIVSVARVCRVRDELTRTLLAPCPLPEPVPCPSLVAVRPEPAQGRGILHVADPASQTYEAMRRATLLFAAYTHRTHRETDNRIAPGDERGLQEVLDRYRASDLVVSSRLHGCILALGLGRKVLAVSGDWKVEAFMSGAGLGEWVLERDQLDRLSRRLHALEDQPVPRAFLERAVRENERVAAEVLALLPGSTRASARDMLAPS